ncbi:hypothetical protein QR680_018904 [Steinernema hermaphroditum]|uniref:Major sperm protein n=1 Tax=Steinernema hermaphroditum TaxID=289476 RepID=A0AA39HJE0_9BILA|nr:hypothetical protein QR680_018904 [Steinernema hermaphroditum]
MEESATQSPMKIDPSRPIYFRRLEALTNLKMINTSKELLAFEIDWMGNIVSTHPTSGYIKPGETVNIKVSALIDEYECDRHSITFYYKTTGPMRTVKYTFRASSISTTGFGVTNTTKELQAFWTFHTTSMKFRIIPPYSYIEPGKSRTIEVATSETASAIDRCLLYIVHGPAENRQLSPDQFCLKNKKFQGYKSLQSEDDISFPESQLLVLPFDNICFSAKDLTAQPNIVDVSITNTTKVLQTFKVKTTSYEIFRVYPPLGYVSPGQTVTIKVTATFKTVPVERHFIASFHIPAYAETGPGVMAGDAQARGHLMRSVQLQERLRCSPVESLRCVQKAVARVKCKP